MKTARIMVTTKCDRGCSYCCNTPENPAMQSCTTVKRLGDIPDTYDAYVITGGEPFRDNCHTAKHSRDVIQRLNAWRAKPVYLYTSVYNMSIPFHALSGITYTLHHPFTDADRNSFWAMELYNQMSGVNRPNMRLIINADIPAHLVPLVNMTAWDKAKYIRFDPDGMCPLGEGEDLYLLEGE